MTDEERPTDPPPPKAKARPIQYPILCFSQGTVMSMETREQFLTCRKRELLRGWYAGLLLVDSAGRAYRLEDAHMVRHAGPLGGIFNLRRKIRVKPRIRKGPWEVSLDALKKRVLETIEDDEAFWADIAPVKGIKRAVEQAASHEALIALPYWRE